LLSLAASARFTGTWAVATAAITAWVGVLDVVDVFV